MVTFQVAFPVKPEGAAEVLGKLARRAVVAPFFALRLAIGAPAPGRIEVEMAWEEKKPPLYAGLKFLRGFWLLMSQLSTTGQLTLVEGPVQGWMAPAPEPAPEPAKASEPSR